MKSWMLAVVAVALATPALAQQPLAMKTDLKLAQAPSDSRCRKDVKDYVETLRLLRDTAGSQTGDLVAGAFISEADLDRTVRASGHCAAAQQLREKRATR